MDTIMDMFLELIRELVAAGDVDYLKFLKKQFEIDKARIGEEFRVADKYNIVCNALATLLTMDQSEKHVLH